MSDHPANKDAIEMLMRQAKELNEQITQFLQQVSDLRTANFALNDEAKTMRAERDDARRMYCLGFTDFCPNPAHEHLSLEDAAAEVAQSFG